MARAEFISQHNQEAIIKEFGLKPGRPEDLRLADSAIHKVHNNSLAKREVYKGLSEYLFYLPERGVTPFVVVDEHQFVFPYLRLLTDIGFFATPQRLIHIDQHSDIHRLKKPVTNLNGRRQFLKYTQEYLTDYNFITALVASEMVNEVDFIGLNIPQYALFDLSVIEDNGGSLKYIPLVSERGFLRRRLVISDFPNNLFTGSYILSIDMDTLDVYKYESRVNHEDNLRMNECVSLLLKSIERVARKQNPPRVILIATSPGFLDGYFNEEEEIIPAVKNLISGLEKIFSL